MKVSKESMKKLGFVLYTDMGYWQHETFHEVCFTELPSWDKIVFNAFQNGRKHGREETQTDIKEALGIYQQRAHIMNEYKEKQNAWQEATDNWVKLTLEKYDGYDINDLTQVFMRGPFAGWSERMVVELAMGMDDANKKVPRHK